MSDDKVASELLDFYQKIQNEQEELLKKPNEFTIREFSANVGVTEKVAKRIVAERVRSGQLKERIIRVGGRISAIYYSLKEHEDGTKLGL